MGFGVGTAPGATLEVRKASTDATIRIRNNSNSWDFKATAGSTRLDILDVNGGTPYMSFFNGGNININNTTSHSKFYVDGSIGLKYTSNSASSFTVTSAHYCIDNNAVAAAITVILPTAASVAGRTYIIRKSDSSGNAVTINTTSSQLINGASSYSLASQYKYVQLMSDGTGWMVIGNN